MTIINKRILGGNNTELDYSFMATIWYLSGFDFTYKCGASYLGKNIILTAAHCVNKRKINHLQIRMGGNNIFEQRHTFKIKSIKVHPLFSPKNLQNDIAIIFLNENPAKYGYKPLNLPCDHMMNEINGVGKSLKVLGYGTDDQNVKNRHLEHLREVDVLVVSRNKCSYSDKIVTSKMILANKEVNGKICDACSGDSGGPAIRKIKNQWIILGIVSWGASLSKKEYPGVYTKVYSYHPWIRKIGGFGKCSNH